MSMLPLRTGQPPLFSTECFFVINGAADATQSRGHAAKYFDRQGGKSTAARTLSGTLHRGGSRICWRGLSTGIYTSFRPDRWVKHDSNMQVFGPSVAGGPGGWSRKRKADRLSQ